jgi:hypothetical protein
MLENRSAAATETTTPRSPTAEPSRLLRSRKTNDVFSGLSKNTTGGRRIADLLRGFLRAMGNPDDTVLQANALRAAELTTAAECARAKLLVGEADADQVVRLEGMADRAVRRLGLAQAAKAPQQSLSEYLASRRAEQTVGSSADDEATEEAAEKTPAGELPDGSGEDVG